MMLLSSSWFYLFVFISPVIITARPVADEQDELFASADITTNSYPDGETAEQADITTNGQPDIIANSYLDEQPIKQLDTSPVPQTDAYSDNFIASSFNSQPLLGETGSGQPSDLSWVTGSDNKAGGQKCDVQMDKEQYMRCLYDIKEMNIPGLPDVYSLYFVGYVGEVVLKKIGPTIKQRWGAVKKKLDRTNKGKKQPKKKPRMADPKIAAELEKIFNDNPSDPNEGTDGSNKPSSWASFFQSLNPDTFRKSIEDDLTDSGCPLRGQLLGLLATAIMGTIIVGLPVGV